MIQRGFTTDGTGEKLTPFPGSPGSGQSVDTDDQEAEEVPFDNSGTDLTATDVQAAIEELSAQVASCCTPGGGQFSSGDLLSTGEVDEISGAGKQDQIYPDFVRPDDADFSWVNQGGAFVVVNPDGSIYLEAPAAAGQNLRGRDMAAPATPYKLRAAFLMNVPMIDFPAAGVFWRESGTGELITLKIIRSVSALGNNEIRCSDMTGPTDAGPVTNAGIDYISFGSGMVWFELEEDASNRYARWSTDGRNFITLFSEGRTVHLTANRLGFFVNAVNAAWPVGATLVSWEFI